MTVRHDVFGFDSEFAKWNSEEDEAYVEEWGNIDFGYDTHQEMLENQLRMVLDEDVKPKNIKVKPREEHLETVNNVQPQPPKFSNIRQSHPVHAVPPKVYNQPSRPVQQKISYNPSPSNDPLSEFLVPNVQHTHKAPQLPSQNTARRVIRVIKKQNGQLSKTQMMQKNIDEVQYQNGRRLVVKTQYPPHQVHTPNYAHRNVITQPVQNPHPTMLFTQTTKRKSSTNIHISSISLIKFKGYSSKPLSLKTPHHASDMPSTYY